MTTALLTASCIDTRPTFIEPPALEAKTCVIEGIEGVYVQEVNGARVRSGEKVDLTRNGNTIRCGVGHVQLKVYVSHSEGSGQWNFVIDTQPGGHYVIRRATANSLTLDIVNRANGSVIRIN